MMVNIDMLLAWGATYKKVKADEIIFQEGGQGYFYYQVVSGSVRWVNIDDEGREFIQYIVEPGGCFGEFPLFDDSVYAASAVANKDSVILHLRKDLFHKLLKQYPEIHFAFSRLLVQRLRFKFLFIKELACSDPESRIIALFSHFKESHTNICKDCSQVLLTRQQIANMTGLRVETVIRTIKSLQHKGSLVINKGKVFC